MRIIAIRHAKSDYPAGVADHDRPLSPRGRRDALVAGDWLDRCEPLSGPDRRVIVSSAERAQETWSIMSGSLHGDWSNSPVVHEADAYHASASTLIALGATGRGSDVAIVAHNPGLQDLVLRAAPSSLRDEAFPRHRTCAIAVLESANLDDWLNGRFEVVDYIVPRGPRE